MIGYLKGFAVDLTPAVTYIDVNGVGYEVHISLNTYHDIKDKKDVFLYIYFHTREDVQMLFGFSKIEEKNAFTKLIGISGIGVNTARIMLSSLTTQELAKILETSDNKALEKIKGIGAKTAQLIILQLKGKINLQEGISENQATSHNKTNNDALNALIGLGISKNMAEAAIKKTLSHHQEQELSIEDIIKISLKNL